MSSNPRNPASSQLVFKQSQANKNSFVQPPKSLEVANVPAPQNPVVQKSQTLQLAPQNPVVQKPQTLQPAPQNPVVQKPQTLQPSSGNQPSDVSQTLQPSMRKNPQQPNNPPPSSGNQPNNPPPSSGNQSVSQTLQPSVRKNPQQPNNPPPNRPQNQVQETEEGSQNTKKKERLASLKKMSFDKFNNPTPVVRAFRNGEKTNYNINVERLGGVLSGAGTRIKSVNLEFENEEIQKTDYWILDWGMLPSCCTPVLATFLCLPITTGQLIQRYNTSFKSACCLTSTSYFILFATSLSLLGISVWLLDLYYNSYESRPSETGDINEKIYNETYLYYFIGSLSGFFFVFMLTWYLIARTTHTVHKQVAISNNIKNYSTSFCGVFWCLCCAQTQIFKQQRIDLNNYKLCSPTAV